LCPSEKIMGVVIVGRNDTGAVVVALAAAVPYVSDPISVEVLAAWRAVVLAAGQSTRIS
jgi:CheY-like chemotaxis protein